MLIMVGWCRGAIAPAERESVWVLPLPLVARGSRSNRSTLALSSDERGHCVETCADVTQFSSTLTDALPRKPPDAVQSKVPSVSVSTASTSEYAKFPVPVPLHQPSLDPDSRAVLTIDALSPPLPPQAVKMSARPNRLTAACSFFISPPLRGTADRRRRGGTSPDRQRLARLRLPA